MVKLKYTIEKLSLVLMEDLRNQSASSADIRPLLRVDLKNMYIGLLKKNYEIPITLSLESLEVMHLQVR